MDMLAFLFVILLIWILFKVTGLMFHIAGHLLGAVFGIIGYLILGVLAVTALGLAFYVLPVLLLIGAGVVVAGLLE